MMETDFLLVFFFWFGNGERRWKIGKETEFEYLNNKSRFRLYRGAPSPLGLLI